MEVNKRERRRRRKRAAIRRLHTPIYTFSQQPIALLLELRRSRALGIHAILQVTLRSVEVLIEADLLLILHVLALRALDRRRALPRPRTHRKPGLVVDRFARILDLLDRRHVVKSVPRLVRLAKGGLDALIAARRRLHRIGLGHHAIADTYNAELLLLRLQLLLPRLRGRQRHL